MSVPRFPRLEAILGSPVGKLSLPDLERAVASRTAERLREDTDLEFKSAVYARDEKGKPELAKDVAAMANGRGGVILIGIAEDPPGEAASIIPISFSDEEERHVRQVLASRVFPLPDYALARIADPGEPGRGVYAIMVPRSSLAPHAVTLNDGWRYPERDGSRTRALSESEIADRYRRRFRRGEGQANRLADVLREGAHEARPARDNETWIGLALVPEVPGGLTLDGARLQQFRQWAGRFGGHLGDGPVVANLPLNASTAVGRIIADSGRDRESGRPVTFYGEFHSDGSGFVARDLGTHHAARSRNSLPGTILLDDEHIVVAMAGMVRMVIEHATETCGARGDALAVSALILSEPSSGAARSITVGDYRDGFWQSSGARTPSNPPVARPCAINLDAVSEDPRERLIATRMLLTDLFHGFGLAEVPQITVEGHLRRAFLNPERLRAWRSIAGVPTNA